MPDIAFPIAPNGSVIIPPMPDIAFPIAPNGSVIALKILPKPIPLGANAFGNGPLPSATVSVTSLGRTISPSCNMANPGCWICLVPSSNQLKGLRAEATAFAPDQAASPTAAAPSYAAPPILENPSLKSPVNTSPTPPTAAPPA